MSAFLCDPYHIGRLARFMADTCNSTFLAHHLEENNPEEHASKLAQILANANLNSVKARYPQDTEGNRPGPGWISTDLEYVLLCRQQARKLLPKLRPAEIIQAAHCLDYQSCEVEDWQQTQARWWILQIIETAALKLEVVSDGKIWELRDPAPHVRQEA